MKSMIFILTIICNLFVSMLVTRQDIKSPHGDIKIECSDCHTTKNWTIRSSDMIFNHEDTGFSLLGGHQQANCRSCHENLVFSFVRTACVDCHIDIHQSKLGNNCEHCHSPINWENRGDLFEQHKQGTFSLLGVHAIIDCESCHFNQQQSEFANTSAECKSCHLEDFNKTLNPNHRSANFNLNCEECHDQTFNSWYNTNFLHSTEFPLLKNHSNVDCKSCHVTAYAQTSEECIACHENDFNNTTQPNHVTFGFVKDCLLCHEKITWENAKFEHSQASDFQLIGAHESIQCSQCHIEGQLTNIPRECFGCHQQDYNSVSDPNHVQNNFGHLCTDCHNTSAWEPSTFDHNQTEFLLTGKHASINCVDCHSAGYSNISTDCYSCHEQDFTEATDPNHVQNNFAHLCSDCHNTSAWEPSTFDHNQTKFQLTGKHNTINCINCHSAGYTNTATDCYSCHNQDFSEAADPNHVLNNFAHLCTDCHNTSAWSPSTFDHNQTQFMLTGKHVSINCVDCHSSGYTNISTDCYSCHELDFNEASNPNHIQNSFGHRCTDCHSTSVWSPSTFDHNQTQFQLTGKHTTVSCIDCHSTGYTNTATDCYSCHEQDFTEAVDPNHVQNNFGHLCTDCHNTSAWSPSTFDHNQTEFQLTGKHTTVSCIDCHSAGYTNTATDCYSCHEEDFTEADEPNHQSNNFSHNCLDCHDVNGWEPSTFDHNQTQFQLTGKHITVSCIDCHSAGYTNTATDCYSCHDQDFSEASDPSHVQNNFSHLCTDCHNTSVWEPSTFDHNQTQFQLVGKHTTVNCIECHSAGYTNTASDCYSCHNQDFTEAEEPNHQTNNFSHNCLDCHDVNGWEPSTFDHNQTSFQLTGGHTNVSCSDCHSSGYTNTTTDCYSCHTQDFNEADEPNHQTNNFSHNCLDCHDVNNWSPATFDHNQTSFQLTGGHKNVTCIDCHITGYNNTSTDCYSCHTQDFNEVSDPNHLTSNFSQSCINCHTVNSWTPATFDHSQTNFQLTGGHINVSCTDCHSSGYNNTPTDCYSCHTQDFNDISDPNHQTNNFSISCLDCHNVNGWTPAMYDHNQTSFQLTGGHKNVACIDCHSSGYNNTPIDCYSCHTQDFNGVSDPNHQDNSFSYNCLDCHDVNGWTPATYDHNQSGFQSTGGHKNVACIDCHSSGYNNTPSDCYSCHTQDFNNVSDPNHQTNNLSHDCLDCHDVNSWSPATFDHNQTSFQLTGGHKYVSCIDCHSSGYNNTPTNCYSCHTQDFNNVSDPNHQTNNFSHNCLDCHDVNNWSPATFDHNQTGFQLQGGHYNVSCIDCHSSGYNNTPTDCYSCHTQDFNNVSDPNHQTNNFSHSCLNCHTINKWTPATFDHNQTDFQLTGGHNNVSCVDCHSSGYNNTPTDCYSCHTQDFNGVSNPNHQTNNLSHSCLNCHTINAWEPATFDHNQTGFQLTGGHNNVSCIDCHSSGYNNTPSDCYSCHTQDFNNVSDPNHQTNNFSHNCLNCHTVNAWEPATFDHDKTDFPLTGQHRYEDCTNCHSSGYSNISTDCYSCHQSDYNNTSDPNHASVQFPTQCQDCHNTSDWDQSTWDHDAQYFPIYSGEHREEWNDCTDCHVSQGNYQHFECINCHEHNRNDTDEDHDEVDNYQYISTRCYECHPNGDE